MAPATLMCAQEAGPHDDVRAVAATAFELITGESLDIALQRLWRRLKKSVRCIIREEIEGQEQYDDEGNVLGACLALAEHRGLIRLKKVRCYHALIWPAAAVKLPFVLLGVFACAVLICMYKCALQRPRRRHSIARLLPCLEFLHASRLHQKRTCILLRVLWLVPRLLCSVHRKGVPQGQMQQS